MHYPPPAINEVHYRFLCFAGRASRYNRVKKNQHNKHPILTTYRQPLHVSDVSRPIIKRYNLMYTAIGTVPMQPRNRQSSKKNNKYKLLYTYGCNS